MKTAYERAIDIIDISETETHLFHGGKSMIVSYLLPNGFTIDGRAGIIDVKLFNLEIGKSVCKQDAIRQLAKILAYNIQSEIQT